MKFTLMGCEKESDLRRFMGIAIFFLILFSVLLSYLFQEIVFDNHCITKLGIILVGNLLFWPGASPLISRFTAANAEKSNFFLLIVPFGILLLTINQLLIQKTIYVIFLYGFGCLDGFSSSMSMLFENNILSSATIFTILVFVAYNKQRKQVAENVSPEITAPTAVTESKRYRTELVLKVDGVKVQIPVRDIRYIEAIKNTILIYTTHQKFVQYQSMISLEKDLDPSEFVKIHRAFLVNKSFIKSAASIGNGNKLITLKCGTELTMTRHFKSQLDL